MRRTGRAALVACVLGACSVSSGGVPPATSVPRPATVAPTSPASTSTTINLIPQTSPDVAAVAFLTAWRSNDRAAAAKVATPATIATVFAQPPAAFSDRGCQVPLAGASTCAFAVDGALVTLHTTTLAGGWVVDGATFE